MKIMKFILHKSLLFNQTLFSIKKRSLARSIVFQPFASFSVGGTSQKSNNFTGKAQNQDKELIIKADSRLASSLENDKMFDHDDKFNLSKIHDIKKVFQLLKQTNYNYRLNDLVYFLRRIVDINEFQILKIDPNDHNDLSNFMRKIKDNLREATQDYPLIGSYAYCFWKLGYKKDEELWLTLGDHIIDDRFYPNFKETVLAVEGFTMLGHFAGQTFINQVYEKLEQLVVMTVGDVNMIYYKRIAESLVQVNRFNPIVFDKLEDHIMNNLSMVYELNTILDILFAFSISGNGSLKFYNAMQYVLFKGKMFNRPWTLDNMIDKPWRGHFIGRICEVYDRAKDKFPNLTLEADFRSFMYNLIINKKANYLLEDLVQVLRHIDVFEFEERDEINNLLEDRLFQIEENMHADDMIKYLDLRVNRDFEGDYTKIPEKILNLFDQYLKKNLMQQDPHKLYLYIEDIEARGLLYEKKDFTNQMVEYVAKNLLHYDFEEACYYYWLFNKYNFLLNMEDRDVATNLNMIKDHIRLGSTFQKGKLSIGSNFYKMLEVVAGNDFISQAEYPDW